MRYFTSAVSVYHTAELSWSDFESVKTRNETSISLREYGRLFSAYILREGDKPGSRLGDYSLETALNVAFFVSYASKYADYQEWAKVRCWFRSHEPSVQNMLVKARIWFQTATRANKSFNITPFGALVTADLNTGAVVLMVHIDHSDC